MICRGLAGLETDGKYNIKKHNVKKRQKILCQGNENSRRRKVLKRQRHPELVSGSQREAGHMHGVYISVRCRSADWP